MAFTPITWVHNVLTFLSSICHVNLLKIIIGLRRQSRSLRNHIRSRSLVRFFALFLVVANSAGEEIGCGKRTWFFGISICVKETFVRILMCLHLHCTIFSDKETISHSLLISVVCLNNFVSGMSWGLEDEWGLDVSTIVWEFLGHLHWKVALHN